MANTSELEAQLTKQQADYLSRLEKAGQLPSVISEAWQKASGEETKKLRGEEAELLTKYGSAGATAREKYKDIWSHTARGSLVAQDIESAYRPIANIRKELAMRAEALGVATQSATAMYGAETERAGTNLGFTESAYQRAAGRESEVTRQRERAEDIAREKSSGGTSKDSSTIDNFNQSLVNGLGYNIATTGQERDDITDDEGNKIDYITREEFIRKLQTVYSDIDKDDISRAVYDYYSG